jgi:predicted anti-sigma-YlaC factor YlaD
MKHLSPGTLVRAIDDELPVDERTAVEEHLAACDTCRARYREAGALTVRLEAMMQGVPVCIPAGARQQLETKMSEFGEASGARKRVWSGLWRWGMAAAAMLTMGVLVVPWFTRERQIDLRAPNTFSSATFDVDGETFVALPYSNPGLPASNSHIVEMQVPVASLASAGVIVEPAFGEGGSVLADVLLGADGEPVGVHVLAHP